MAVVSLSETVNRLAPATNSHLNESQETQMQTSVTKKTVSIVLSVLISCAAIGDAQALVIRGAPSCGVWIKERADDKLETIANNVWLLGFLSGMAVKSGKDILKGTDNPSIFLWVDNYCRANPLKTPGDAGDALFEELVKQKRL